MIETKIIKELL